MKFYSNKKIIIALLLAGGAGIWLLGLSSISMPFSVSSRSSFSNKKIVLYKTLTCGCCGNYVAYLRRYGYKVKIVKTSNLFSIKDRYHIPYKMQSCHTADWGDYFVEGHVPLEAVRKMLSEKPLIDGIALPGMPAGSPGMPGFKREPFKIYSLVNGQAAVFMKL